MAKKKRYDGPSLWIDKNPYFCCFCKRRTFEPYYRPWNSDIYCAACWESIPFDPDNDVGEQEIVTAFEKKGLIVGGAPVGWPGWWMQVIFDGDVRVNRIFYKHLSYTSEGRISRLLVEKNPQKEAKTGAKITSKGKQGTIICRESIRSGEEDIVTGYYVIWDGSNKPALMAKDQEFDVVG